MEDRIPDLLPQAQTGAAFKAFESLERAIAGLREWMGDNDTATPVESICETVEAFDAWKDAGRGTSDPLPNPLLVPLTRYADALGAVARQEGCGESTRAKLEEAAMLVRSAAGGDFGHLTGPLFVADGDDESGVPVFRPVYTARPTDAPATMTREEAGLRLADLSAQARQMVDLDNPRECLRSFNTCLRSGPLDVYRARDILRAYVAGQDAQVGAK